jgi:hypothetical protein
VCSGRGVVRVLVLVTAYGWEWPLSEDEVLSRLLVLNLEQGEVLLSPSQGRGWERPEERWRERQEGEKGRR